eukprot:COSAG02_NODE_2445_length_8843_cov_21.333143_7_plen_134_part_00
MILAKFSVALSIIMDKPLRRWVSSARPAVMNRKVVVRRTKFHPTGFLLSEFHRAFPWDFCLAKFHDGRRGLRSCHVMMTLRRTPLLPPGWGLGRPSCSGIEASTVVRAAVSSAGPGHGGGRGSVLAQTGFCQL